MSTESGHHPIDLLSACIDGEIAPGERRLLESHLETCDRCATLLRDMEALSRAAASEPAPPVPAGLEAKVMARVGSAVRARPARALRSGWGFRLPVAAAAALAGALALWVAARGFRETTTGPIAPPPVASPSLTGEDASRDRAPGAGEEGAAGESDLSKTQGELDPSHHGEAAPVEALGKEDESDLGAGGPERGAPTDSPGGFAPSPPSTEAGPAAAGEKARSARPPAPSVQELRREGPSRGDEGQTAEREDAAAPAPAAGIMTLAAAPAVLERQLTLREDSRLTITLSESGSLHLEAGGYSCALDLIPEVWVEGLPGKGPSRQPGAGPPPTSWTLAEISALFDALPQGPAGDEVSPSPGDSRKRDQPPAGANTKEGGSRAERSPAGSTTGSGATPSWPQGLSMLDRDGSVRALAGPGLDEPAPGKRATVADRLRRLALEMHRSLIEESCGPLPDGLGP